MVQSSVQQIYYDKNIAFHFEVLDKLEVGLVLFGWEAKSLKAGRFNFKPAFIDFTPDQQLVFKGAQISPWETAPRVGQDLQKRNRNVLAHRREALKIGLASKRPGYSLVPLEMFVTDKGLIKMIIALVKGKKRFEKKEVIKERDQKRQMEMDMKMLRY